MQDEYNPGFVKRYHALFRRMGLNVLKHALHVTRQCPASPELQGKRRDWNYNEQLKKSRFKVFTKDHKEMAFDKLAQMDRNANT